LLLWFFLPATGCGGFAADWPQWRGPAWNGVGDAVIDEAAVRKKLSIAADEVVLCADAATGKTLWTHVFLRSNDNGYCVGAR
jgi:hypothetical protein